MSEIILPVLSRNLAPGLVSAGDLCCGGTVQQTEQVLVITCNKEARLGDIIRGLKGCKSGMLCVRSHEWPVIYRGLVPGGGHICPKVLSRGCPGWLQEQGGTRVPQVCIMVISN